MEKQAVDYLLLEFLVSTTSLESLAKGYILNCKTENESPKTISGYEMTLRNFIWYCKQNNFPEIQKLTGVPPFLVLTLQQAGVVYACSLDQTKDKTCKSCSLGCALE